MKCSEKQCPFPAGPSGQCREHTLYFTDSVPFSQAKPSFPKRDTDSVQTSERIRSRASYYALHGEAIRKRMRDRARKVAAEKRAHKTVDVATQ